MHQQLARWVFVGVASFTIPASMGAQPSPPEFDPEAATQAYLSRLSPEEKARSDAYFEGGYWLQGLGFVYGLAIAGFLLSSRLSARLRDVAERAARRRSLQTALYAVFFTLVTTLFEFPLAVYRDFIREHSYGLSNHTFASWLGDEAKLLAVTLLLLTVFLVLLYGVIRRAPRNWWLWGSAVSVLFAAFTALIAPVFINPLVNTYRPLADPELRSSILSMARANGVPADEVYQYDASRQTKRVSANVSGFLGTLRISLNDNLLERCSLEEIRDVMGHEIGHYVLNHAYEGFVFAGLLLVGGFAFLRWGFARAYRRWGARWDLRGIEDPAGLPLLGALLSIYLFVTAPAVNTFSRSIEAEADLFGLNAAREPDAYAEVVLKLAEYRKLDPGRLEEWVFYDHPSGRARILMAMRWKAEQPRPSDDPR